MADLLTGADSDCSWEECYGCEEYNANKNHWFGATPPTAPVEGLLWEKNDGTVYMYFDGEWVQLYNSFSKHTFQNILTNSGFGVWSQSDANKGLGTLVYDNLAVSTFQVGETITTVAPPGGSGATGKVITNIGTTLVLGACDGRFNDNEQITGATSGATADVNMPDVAVGVDLVRNGEFEAGIGGWTADNAILASIAGGQVGNCLEVTRIAGGNQGAYLSCVTVEGKIYKATVYVKSGTSGNEAFKIQLWDVTNGVELIGLEGTSGGAWVAYTITCEAGSVNTRIRVFKMTATAGTMLFDEVSLYEITPCCTATDALAFDNWYKDTTLDLYRQHNDGGTFTKDGRFYALRFVPSAVGDYVAFPNGQHSLEEWRQIFAGRTVTFGAWVKTSTASHFHLSIYDNADHFSPYHTGGGGWEWLEVTWTINAAPASTIATLRSEIAPNVDGTTIVYISQPMLVLGASIGEGNYQPRQQEIIRLEVQIPSNKFEGLVSQSSEGWIDLNIEADTDAKLPKGCKWIRLTSTARDSASLGADCMFLLRGIEIEAEYNNRPYGRASDTWNAVTGDLSCDINGDIDYYISATGANTFDFSVLRYHAVQIN